AQPGRGAQPGRRPADRRHHGEGLDRAGHRDRAARARHARGRRHRLDRIGLRRHGAAGDRRQGGGHPRMNLPGMNPLMTHIIDPLRDWLLSLGAIGIVIWLVLAILAIAVPVILSVAFYVVWERKLLGWMHVRHGPMYVGMGVFQAFADVFKLLFKEVIKPSASHRVLYVLAPLIGLVPAFAAWAVVPFDSQVVLSDANAGLLYLLAMTSLGVYGIIIAGWATNSKYA